MATLPLFFLGLSLDGQTLVASSASEMVRAAMARRESFFSGRMAFREVVSKGEFSREARGTRRRLVFSSPDWRMTLPDSGYAYASFKGNSVALYPEQLRDGSGKHLLSLATADTMNSRSFTNVPFFVGSLWWGQTSVFLKANAERAEFRGEEIVEGHQCRIIEVEIKKEERAAWTFSDINRNGGFVRMWIAPELGYAIPRVEELGNDRRVAGIYLSSEFKEYTSGLFLPRQCHCVFYSSSGATYSHAFRDIEYADVNGEIPSAAFTIEVSQNTTIADQRGGHEGKGVSVFKAADSEQVNRAGLVGLVSVAPPKEAGWWNTFAIALAGVACLILACIVFRHRLGKLARKLP